MKLIKTLIKNKKTLFPGLAILLFLLAFIPLASVRGQTSYNTYLPYEKTLYYNDCSNTTNWNSNYAYYTSSNSVMNITAKEGFTFEYEDLNNAYDDGDDSFIGFTSIDNANDRVNIASDKVYQGSRSVKIENLDTSYVGLNKTDFNSTADDTLLEFRFMIYITDMADGSDDAVFWVRFFSSDSTRLFILQFTSYGSLAQLKWWNTASSSYEVLNTIDQNEWIEIVITIDYTNDWFYVLYDCASNTYFHTELPLESSGKNGCSYIVFYGRRYGVGDGFTVWLDQIIFNEPTTLDREIETSGYCSDYQRVSLTFPASNYVYQDNYSCSRVNGSGNFNIYGNAGMNFYNGIDNYTYTYFNNYDLANTLTQLNFYVINKESIFIDDIKIYNTYISNGDDDSYIKIETTSDIDKDDYYYISTNKLIFNNTYETGNNESVTAVFDIENTPTGEFDYIKLIAYELGNGDGLARFNFTDSSYQEITLPNYYPSFRLGLGHEKTIDCFILNLQDDDNYESDQVNVLYFYEFEVTEYGGFTYTTYSLVSILPMLLMLIVPTLLIYVKTGSAYSIAPVLLLMSTICFVTSLMPLWLYFIILITLGSIIITSMGLKWSGYS